MTGKSQEELIAQYEAEQLEAELAGTNTESITLEGQTFDVNPAEEP